ncbi:MULTISPECIES: (Na+)-NQR maturation NqrM [Corallincola]|uniref:(Na+)-NQR maturation NqrM n=3 Tax=Corallincola TaxID=1775176 RepID=A0A368NHB5_9GAMM|nr:MULTISPECIES: (Na+)-NQR maturation NqrM [Corallincola]RCU49125.1 (Na+)-NQR maturation NqrM [Corallincola holothuriorum]TAA47562.1 (Na+)-NQR maturation NqrM [Corallincola spongiicola]TCI05244.1 (Na+)-NQR maturation NqrM [Corallincola luteus]
MTVFLLTFGLLLTVVAAMAIGYLLQRKKIAGSCGGIAALGMDKVCDCPEPCEKRRKREAKEERRREMLEKHRII